MHQNPSSVEISVVIPLLNEEESLTPLYHRILEALPTQSFEVVFVDDGSTDGSWDVIRTLASGDKRVKGIQFRRNYGKSQALQAGFNQCTGEFIITMDADLQDDPFEIPELVALLKEGNDLVSGWKKKRHDPITKTIPSRFFNYVTRKTTGIPLHDFNCGLKAYRREVVQHIKLHGELHRYIPLLAKDAGFNRITEKVVQHHARQFGRSKFGFSRFVKGFLDLATLLFLLHYLQRPMHFFGTLGTLFSLAGTTIIGYLTVMRLFFEQFLSNRPLLIYGVLLLVLGFQFFSVGLLGELINTRTEKVNTVNIKDELNLS